MVEEMLKVVVTRRIIGGLALAALSLVVAVVFWPAGDGAPQVASERTERASTEDAAGEVAATSDTAEVGAARDTGGVSGDSNKSGPVTIVAVGDVIFGGLAGSRMRAEGIDYPFQRTKSAIAGADIAIANMEGSLSTRGSAAAKAYTFRSPPIWATSLSLAGFDVATIANNHILDFGADALTDTVNSLGDAGIEVIGGGADSAAARRPVVFTKNGTRIAIVAFSDVIPAASWVAGKGHPGVARAGDPAKVKAAIKKAGRKADEVIAVFHWGTELQSRANGRQESLAAAAVTGGAALVIGHHPHVLQPMERRGRAVVAYSLGNFVHTPPTASARKGGLLVATITPGAPTRVTLKTVNIVAGQPRLTGDETTMKGR